TWHLPVYALVALALSPPSPTLSIDRVWARRAPRVGRWLGVRPEGGGVSIARTLVLVAAVGMLFSSGIAKLLDAGPAWVDGHSLSAYLSWSWQHSLPPRWPALAHLLLRHPALLTALSAVTLAIELGAVGALVGRRLRHATLAAAAAMHVVIALTMLPLFIAHL